MVAGVVLAGSGAAAHDVYGTVMRRGASTEREEGARASFDEVRVRSATGLGSEKAPGAAA